MKIQSSKPLANGNFKVTVELEPSERLIAIRDNAHYQLGYPVSDVVASHIIENCTQVTWCSASQQWVE